jgi:elongation factor 1-alpha
LVDSEKKMENALSFTNNKKNRKIPIFNISNKTGKGLNFLKDFINELQPSGIWKQFVNEDESVMYIDCTYNVPGVGLVLSGTVTQGCIKRGQILFLGPYNHNNPFRRIVAKTLHNNVRQSVLELKSGDTGCIAIRGIKNIVKRDKITKGFIITSKEQPVTRIFIADIYILKTNRTSIRKGFEGTFYCRNVKCTARILQIHNKKNKEIDCLRGGERAYVKLELLKSDRFLEAKSKIIFREGLVKAVGKVYKCL